MNYSEHIAEYVDDIYCASNSINDNLIPKCTPLFDQTSYHKITQEQYEEFKRYYLIDVLKGKRYGQAFCDKFNIPNGTPLYYLNSHEICDRWITDNYLVKK